MKDIEKIRILILKTRSERNNEIKKSINYSLLLTFILSKEIFKKNIDIKPFLEENNIFLKDYLYGNRTALVARLIRIFEKMEQNEINNFNKSIYDLAFSETLNKNKGSVKKDKVDNYFDELLNNFERKRGN